MTEPGPGTTGSTIICDGNGGVTVQMQSLSPLYQKCIGDCIMAHENSHMQDVLKADPNICAGKPKGTLITYSSIQEKRASEIKAITIELNCLINKLALPCPECEVIIK